MDMRFNKLPSYKPWLPSLDSLPVWLRGWKSIWVLGAAAYILIFSIWILFKWTNPAHELLIANLGYLPLGFFSVISALYTANQQLINQRTRRAWQLMALSLIFLVTADIIYLALELTKGIGFPNIADFFYLMFYPLAFIGVITIPSQLSDPAQKKTWKLDLSIIITGITAILWFFLIAPTAASSGEGWAVHLVAGAYPAMDVVLLASIASLLFRKSEINTRNSLYILGFGLLIYVIADIAYAWLVLRDLYSSGSAVDILWTISYFVIGLAALRQATPYLVEPQETKKSQTTWLISIPPFLVVAASVVTSFYAARSGTSSGLQSDGLYFGTIVAIFLTIARQVITTREHSRLVDELNLISDQLRNNAGILEERVRERTRELESETNRLRLTAQIAREAASVRDVEGLLKRSASLIQERFDLYHTGIFLLDQKREYVVLTTSPTIAGQQMIAENYKLLISDQDVVAQAAAKGEPVATVEAGYVRNPLLPDTRSEMALPLKVENNVIGVLDVQSDRPQTFNEEDVAIMQVMADQLATALERTRLLQEVEKNLKELEGAYGQFTRDNWKKLSNGTTAGKMGYRFDNVRLEPITKLPELADDAFKTGTMISSNGNHMETNKERTVAIPIKLREQTIGVVSIRLKEGYDSNTISIIESAVERLASAMESARLYEEARMRADRELSISRVTTAISGSTEYEQILQTTVREIGNLLSDTEVAIQILEEPAGVKRLERREQ